MLHCSSAALTELQRNDHISRSGRDCAGDAVQLRRMIEMQFFVKAEWDDDARVWYTADTDIPGLVVEAPTLEEFNKLVFELAPEMVHLNAHHLSGERDDSYPISIIAHQEMKICA